MWRSHWAVYFFCPNVGSIALYIFFNYRNEKNYTLLPNISYTKVLDFSIVPYEAAVISTPVVRKKV